MKSIKRRTIVTYVFFFFKKGTETDVAAKEKELFEMITLLYAAPTRPGQRPMFDFFLYVFF